MKVIFKSEHKDLGNEHGIFSVNLEVLTGSKHITTREELVAILSQAVEDIQKDETIVSV